MGGQGPCTRGTCVPVVIACECGPGRVLQRGDNQYATVVYPRDPELCWLCLCGGEFLSS